MGKEVGRIGRGGQIKVGIKADVLRKGRVRKGDNVREGRRKRGNDDIEWKMKERIYIT